jgi:hypothetical protein
MTYISRANQYARHKELREEPQPTWKIEEPPPVVVKVTSTVEEISRATIVNESNGSSYLGQVVEPNRMQIHQGKVANLVPRLIPDS